MQWKKPIVGRVKLNSDGCSKGNPGQSGGRAILRSHFGDLICAIGDRYGCQTNMVAEARSLHQGLEKCIHTGFHAVDIEVDSLILVQLLCNKAGVPWKIAYEGLDIFDKC